MQKLVLPLFAAFIASGCVVERDVSSSMELSSDQFDYRSDFYSDSASNVEVLRGRLGGDIGSMQNMDGPAQLSGSHYGDYTDVEVILQNERGAAMAYLTFEGGIDNPSLEPGNTYTFSAYEYNTEGDLNVYGYACSGNEVYNWTYDEPMDEVEIEVVETDEPDVVTLKFTTTQGGEQAWGSLDVAR